MEEPVTKPQLNAKFRRGQSQLSPPEILENQIE
jgi:hypothetical protein